MYHQMNTVMKKFLLLATLAIVSGTTLKAQYFVASYGYVHGWDIPQAVSYAIEDNYWGYEMIHAERINHHGRLSFNVMLQRGNRFVEVTVNRKGRIIETVKWNHFPLQSHVCGDYCGFHSNYYLTYYRPDHHGHQHYYGCGHYVPKVKVVYHNGYDVYKHGHKIKKHHPKGKKHYAAVKDKHYYPVKSTSRDGRTARGYNYSKYEARERRVQRNH